MRRVGILGGMGPEATVLLMQRLIRAVPAADDADHVPLIVDQNTQVPSRLRFLLDGEGEDPGPVLAAMARRLEAAGAGALAMPCNTAHHFAPQIRAATALPFLDMVELAVTAARKAAPPGGRIGLLASPALRRVGLYDRALARAGLTALWPEDEAPVLDAIRRVKSGGADDTAAQMLREASDSLARQGAALQIIACTELSLVEASGGPQAARIDSLDLLVRAILSFAKPGPGPDDDCNNGETT